MELIDVTDATWVPSFSTLYNKFAKTHLEIPLRQIGARCEARGINMRALVLSMLNPHDLRLGDYTDGPTKEESRAAFGALLSLIYYTGLPAVGLHSPDKQGAVQSVNAPLEDCWFLDKFRFGPHTISTLRVTTTVVLLLAISSNQWQALANAAPTSWSDKAACLLPEEVLDIPHFDVDEYVRPS